MEYTRARPHGHAMLINQLISSYSFLFSIFLEHTRNGNINYNLHCSNVDLDHVDEDIYI